jgi:hypothetical protein
MAGKKRDKTRMPRSWIAVAAHARTSAGLMGGSARHRKRRERRDAREQIRRGDWDG